MSAINIKISHPNPWWDDDQDITDAAVAFLQQAAKVAGKHVTISVTNDKNVYAVDGPRGVYDLLHDAWRKKILAMMAEDDLDATGAVAKLQDIYRSKGGDANLKVLFEAIEQEPLSEGTKLDTVIGTQKLGGRMHHWHSSMSDPIYGVGSMFVAGKPALRSEVEKAIKNLHISGANRDNPDHKEAEKLANDLRKLIGEPPVKEPVNEAKDFESKLNSASIFDYIHNTPSIWKKYVEPYIQKYGNGKGDYDRDQLIALILMTAKNSVVSGFKKEFKDDFNAMFPTGTVPYPILRSAIETLVTYLEKEYKFGKLAESEYSDTKDAARSMPQKDIDAELSSVKSDIKTAFNNKDHESLKKLQDKERALVHASIGTSSESVNESIKVLVSGDPSNPGDLETMSLVSRVIQAILGLPSGAEVGTEDSEAKTESVLAEQTSSAVINRQISQNPKANDLRLKKQVGSSTAGKIDRGLEDLPSLDVSQTKDGLTIIFGKDDESKAYVAKMAAKIAADKSVPSDAPLVVIFPSQTEAFKANITKVIRILKANVEGRDNPNWLAARRRIEKLLGGDGPGGDDTTKKSAEEEAMAPNTDGSEMNRVVPESKSEYSSINDEAMIECLYQASAIEKAISEGNAAAKVYNENKQALVDKATAFGGRIKSGSYLIESNVGDLIVTEGVNDSLVDIEFGDTPRLFKEASEVIERCQNEITLAESAFNKAKDELSKSEGSGFVRGDFSTAYFVDGGDVLIAPGPIGFNENLDRDVLALTASKIFDESRNVWKKQVAKSAAYVKGVLDVMENTEVKDLNDNVILKVENHDIASENVIDAATQLVSFGISDNWIKHLAFIGECSKYEDWVENNESIKKLTIDEEFDSSDMGWSDADDVWDSKENKPVNGATTVVTSVDVYHKSNKAPKPATIVRKNGKTYLIDRSGPKARKRMANTNINLTGKTSHVELTDSFEPSDNLALDTFNALKSESVSLTSAMNLSNIVSRWLTEAGENKEASALREEASAIISLTSNVTSPAIVMHVAENYYSKNANRFGEVGKKVLEKISSLRGTLNTSTPVLSESVFERILSDHNTKVQDILAENSPLKVPGNISAEASRINRTLTNIASSGKRLSDDTINHVLVCINNLIRLGGEVLHHHREEAPEQHATFEKSNHIKTWNDSMQNKFKDKSISDRISVLGNAIKELKENLSKLSLKEERANAFVRVISMAISTAMTVLHTISAQVHPQESSAKAN